MFNVETSQTIYELELYHVQANITTRCNMRCDHCRGAYCKAAEKDLSSRDFENLIAFSYEHLTEGGGYLISGGEPFLHPEFPAFISLLKKYMWKDTFVAITTNGTSINPRQLDFLQAQNFPELRISISLDSIIPERHNQFRHHANAFENAVQAIKLVSERPNVRCIVRATIQKDQLHEIEPLADLAKSLGADTFSISSIIPAGSAADKPELGFDKKSKKEMISLISLLRKKRLGLIIDTNDPLAYIDDACLVECGQYGGCIAGIGTFSVEPDGSMLPCPLLPNRVITNILGKSPQQIQADYVSSQYVLDLVERKLKGKCGGCDLRFECGGCRARADGILGDYLEEDPECWL